METVTFDIIAPEDRQLIMGFLLVPAEESRIRLNSRQYDPAILPGKSMTAEKLNNRIDEAERGPRLSFEEAKVRSGIRRLAADR